MEEYKPNSHKYKQEQRELAEKTVKAVTKGSAKVKKKSEFRKFTGAIISEDATNVGAYILTEVLVPAIKKAVSDVVTNGIDMLLYGETRSNKNSSYHKVSYSNYYGSSNERRTTSVKSRFDYDDIVFESRGDAEEARMQMLEIIDRYGFVTVADMYDMAQITAPYTSNKYGWTNLRNAEVVRIRDGYIVKLPKALPID